MTWWVPFESLTSSTPSRLTLFLRSRRFSLRILFLSATCAPLFLSAVVPVSILRSTVELLQPPASLMKMALQCSTMNCTTSVLAWVSLTSRARLSGRMTVGAKTTAQFMLVMRFSRSRSTTRAR